MELDDPFLQVPALCRKRKIPILLNWVRGKSEQSHWRCCHITDHAERIAFGIYKDMQEDKEAIFDAVDTLRMCLTAFILW